MTTFFCQVEGDEGSCGVTNGDDGPADGKSIQQCFSYFHAACQFVRVECECLPGSSPVKRAFREAKGCSIKGDYTAAGCL